MINAENPDMVLIAGDIIGTVGSTGNTSGAHLHFEITKDGINLNPSDFID